VEVAPTAPRAPEVLAAVPVRPDVPARPGAVAGRAVVIPLRRAVAEIAPGSSQTPSVRHAREARAPTADPELASHGSAAAIVRAALRPEPARVVHVQIQTPGLVPGSPMTIGRRVAMTSPATSAVGATTVAPARATAILIAVVPPATGRSRVPLTVVPRVRGVVTMTGRHVRRPVVVMIAVPRVRGAATMTVPLVRPPAADARRAAKAMAARIVRRAPELVAALVTAVIRVPIVAPVTASIW